MRIVIAGLAATYPLGGVFWDYLQYAQGFVDLGHEVLYLEDTGTWFYDPANLTMVESGKDATEWFGREIDRHLPALSKSWFVRDAHQVPYGLDEGKVRQFCRDAELFLNVSGATVLQPDDLCQARSAYIDSDPMYTQCMVPSALVGTLSPQERKRLDCMLSYDLTFSFGENIGRPDCLVPDQFFDWVPTRQPVLTHTIARYREPVSRRKRKLTTIGSWDPYAKPITVAGQIYEGKLREFQRFRSLPQWSPVPLELAMAGAGPASEMQSLGWNVIDPYPVSATADRYLEYLATSFAEWSVAKHAYVASKSGWFSGRSAVYLGLGVPAIVQNTGFSRFLPTGEGLVAFSTPDEALAAIDEVATNYERHCAAALEIAHEHFDAKGVLSRLIDDVFSSSNAPAPSSKPERSS